MLEFVIKNKKQPFFLYYPTVLPHLPLQAPKEDIEEYKGLWPETPYNGRSYQPHPTPRACYAAMISFLDKQIGRLMALLKNLNLDRNTIVMFTSDNGSTHLRSQVDYDFFDSVSENCGATVRPDATQGSQQSTQKNNKHVWEKIPNWRQRMIENTASKRSRRLGSQQCN